MQQALAIATKDAGWVPPRIIHIKDEFFPLPALHPKIARVEYEEFLASGGCEI